MQAKDLLPLKTNALDRLETHELLIVGILPFGKGFAECKAQLKDEDQRRRRVVVSDSLPLKRVDDTRASVDFLCFVVSMKSKLSFDKVKDSLSAVVPAEQGFFVMGRWGLVILDAAEPSKFAFTLDDVHIFAKSNSLPVLFGGSLGDSKAMDYLCGRVATLLKRSTRHVGVSPMFQLSSFPRPS